ncbi:MAG TPA: acyloxyacyl hydrolase [Sphingomicrobium sp.]|nr:acyloxyacyl hydrolase [Sphingomicrobium sp.]
MTIARIAIALAGACLASAPAAAGEIFGGVYVHDVDTPLSRSGIEGGLDLQLGWRGGRIAGTPLQPYIYGSAHTKGRTHFAAAGLSARFGDQFFIRPGVGLAVHSGSARKFQDPTNDRIDFGNRILFAPELGVGARIGPRTSLEASWVHLSHAQLFGRQNPGMDSIGMRLTVELP